MNNLYKYSLCYYAFVKKSNIQRAFRFGEWYFVANIFLYINVKVLFFIFDLFLPFKGIESLMHGPMSFLFDCMVIFLITSIVELIRVKATNKRQLMRYAIAKTSKINKVYSFLFIICSVLAYVFVIRMSNASS